VVGAAYVVGAAFVVVDSLSRLSTSLEASWTASCALRAASLAILAYSSASLASKRSWSS
jgi:hypothetical protein